MITIVNSRVNYKAPDGGVTRRKEEHFIKRIVVFLADGEERQIDIPKSELPMGATEEQIVSYIENNIDRSIITNGHIKRIQESIDTLVLENLLRG